MSLIIVAPTVQEATLYATDAGLMAQAPIFISPGSTSGFSGHRDATVIVINRSRLPLTMENSLSMIAQQRGTIVVTIPEENRVSSFGRDTLNQMSQEAFLSNFLQRFGPGEHRVQGVTSGKEWVVAIREAIEPPQFETAEEALEWLDSQAPDERDRLERIKAAENAAWTGQPGPRRSGKLIR